MCKLHVMTHTWETYVYTELFFFCKHYYFGINTKQIILHKLSFIFGFNIRLAIFTKCFLLSFDDWSFVGKKTLSYLLCFGIVIVLSSALSIASFLFNSRTETPTCVPSTASNLGLCLHHGSISFLKSIFIAESHEKNQKTNVTALINAALLFVTELYIRFIWLTNAVKEIFDEKPRNKWCFFRKLPKPQAPNVHCPNKRARFWAHPPALVDASSFF